MNKRVFWILLSFIAGCLGARPITPSTRIALLDLTLRSSASYRVFISLEKAVGTTVVYLHPSKKLAHDLCGCEGVFIAFDPYFLRAGLSEYTNLTIEPLKQFVAQGKKFIGLLLPEQLVDAKTSSLVTKFLADIGLISATYEEDIQLFLAHKRSAVPSYTTAQQTADKAHRSLPHFAHVIALPQQRVPGILDNNMPMGIFWTAENDNHVLLTTRATLTFADLHEEGFLNPIDPKTRKDLLRATMSMLSYVQEQCSHINNEPVPTIDCRVLNQLVGKKTEQLTCTAFEKQQGIYKWTSNGISCGWLSVDYDRELMPKNLAYVAQTDFDVLWLELPMGLYQDPAKFDEKMAYFAQQLLKAYKDAHRELPKIIIDFNLGAILQWHKYASMPIDIYGNQYQNVPAPFDFDGFWHPAIIAVFKTVIKQWQTSTHRQIPIDGVLFNLYFWNTKNHKYVMPFYSNLIDVSDSAWDYYTLKNTVREPLTSAHGRVNYLMRTNNLENYLATLEAGAFEIGQRIANDVHELLPCAMLGIYTSAPLDTWFYRGFARALGSEERPLLWFTENLDFYGHQEWLANNKIHALHSTNILLHHFNNKKDVANINQLAKSHDGLWYSRVSRIGEKYQPDKWWSAEATTMVPEELVKIIGKQARK